MINIRKRKKNYLKVKHIVRGIHRNVHVDTDQNNVSILSKIPMTLLNICQSCTCYD